MHVRKVQIKLYATENQKGSLDSYIPIFHRWVREGVPDEMVYDVADYTHVPRGTGVLLVGHASDYSIDQGEDRPGLLYSRKRDLPEGAGLVEDALKRVLAAAKKLNEDDEVKGPQAFSPQEFLIRFPDRLHVANDDAGLALVSPSIHSALLALLPGKEHQLSREGESREPLTIRVQEK